MQDLDYNQTQVAIVNEDFYLVHEDEDTGVKYYAPQDDGDNIIGVHEEAQVAVVTDFCEVEDFLPLPAFGALLPSDYALQLNADSSSLVCNFEA